MPRPQLFAAAGAGMFVSELSSLFWAPCSGMAGHAPAPGRGPFQQGDLFLLLFVGVCTATLAAGR